MPDYRNMVMVWNGVMTFDPVMEGLVGLTVEQLGDESVMTQFDFYAEGRRWYPIIDKSPLLQRYQSYVDQGVVTFDPATKVASRLRAVRDWPPEEILAYKKSITRYISKLAFRNRLTQAEKIAFEMAQVDDPTAPQAARLVAAGVRVMEKDLAVSQYINLNDPATQGGLHQLEALGVLAAGRADMIIWSDIQPTEVP